MLKFNKEASIFSIFSKNEKGALHLLVLIAAIGLISFMLISNTFDFKNKLFKLLFPKIPSQAASCQSDGTQTVVDQYCLNGVLIKVFSHLENNECKLFYEPAAGSCDQIPSSSPIASAIPTSIPTHVPTSAPTSIPVPTALPVPTPASANGLTGNYFDNNNLTNFKLTRMDQTVNFNWEGGSPAVELGNDTYSVRWTGKVIPQFSQNYTFFVKSDDGARLWINNQLTIDKWTNHGSKEWSGSVNLTANQKYDIKLEYFENTGKAFVELRWQSNSQSKQIIPQSRLLPF